MMDRKTAGKLCGPATNRGMRELYKKTDLVADTDRGILQ
jgi:hypothetical protein